MKFKVIAGPKAHIGKIINIGDYTKTTGFNEHGEFIRFEGKRLIEFAKENGYSKEYFTEVTEYGNRDMLMVLIPLRGYRITLRVEVADFTPNH